MSTSVRFETGKYGVRAVLLAACDAATLRAMQDAGVQECEINHARGWRGENVDFVTSLPGLQGLDILDFSLKSVASIHALRGLRSLKVSTYCDTPLRAECFPCLESCSLEWRAGSESVFDCTTLRSLFLNRFSGRSEVPVHRLTRLLSLTLLNSAIESLSSLSALSRLVYLRLGGLRRLRSLAGIESLSSLEELDVNTCRGLTMIDEVRHLTRLKRLLLNNCGAIQTLTPIRTLAELELVSFYESTNIVDGDLSPLVRPERPIVAAFRERRHYSHTRAQLGQV